MQLQKDQCLLRFQQFFSTTVKVNTNTSLLTQYLYQASSPFKQYKYLQYVQSSSSLRSEASSLLCCFPMVHSIQSLLLCSTLKLLPQVSPKRLLGHPLTLSTHKTQPHLMRYHSDNYLESKEKGKYTQNHVLERCL